MPLIAQLTFAVPTGKSLGSANWTDILELREFEVVTAKRQEVEEPTCSVRQLIFNASYPAVAEYAIVWLAR